MKMSKRPAWAIEIKIIMLKFGITNRQIADAIGKSEQWVSNIITGYVANEQMKKEICNYIYVITKSQKVS